MSYTPPDSLCDRLLAGPAGPHWRRIGIRQHHGIVAPLFSLHSHMSCGIGEFLDLIPLIDWCAEVGMDVIQLLPLNDSGPDSSPYSALSAYALHPIYLSLHALPCLEKHPAILSRLSLRPRVAYQEVLQAKRDFLRTHYALQLKELTSCPDYQHFLTNNSSWLIPYALFKSIKKEQEWRPWKEWPQELRDPCLDELSAKYRDDIDYHCAIQYLCFQQMEEVREYAETKGVLLMGDIPILISAESADVWAERKFFDTNLSAGAPADMYAEEGQNWGFPLYNWDALAKDDYNWWRRRLHIAEKLYHIYRLDHIVGFFRIWGIEPGHSALEGRFYPEDKNLWIPQGERIMKMLLDSSTMLPIGEDLGVVPPKVRQKLRSLGISGTKIMRWERRWDEDQAFIPVEDYPAESMTSVSTHDSETLRGWWEACGEEAQEYCKQRSWQYTGDITKEQQRSILRDSHLSGSLFHINPLTEYLDLLKGLAWDDSPDNRVNVPGAISERNWTVRQRITVEDLKANQGLIDVVRNLLYRPQT